jgi:hypothetical protein
MLSQNNKRSMRLVVTRWLSVVSMAVMMWHAAVQNKMAHLWAAMDGERGQHFARMCRKWPARYCLQMDHAWNKPCNLLAALA